MRSRLIGCRSGQMCACGALAKTAPVPARSTSHVRDGHAARHGEVTAMTKEGRHASNPDNQEARKSLKEVIN
jgi:hypothetical protein